MELERQQRLITDRQQQVLALVAEGNSNKSIASELVISERTVRRSANGTCAQSAGGCLTRELPTPREIIRVAHELGEAGVERRHLGLFEFHHAFRSS